MNCKKIQDLILTDYIDQELDLEGRKQIDLHLENCEACQEVLLHVQKEATEPLEHAQKVSVPQSVWNEIKREIIEKAERKTLIEEAYGHVKDFFVVRRPVFALSTALVVLLLVVSFVRMPGLMDKKVSYSGDVHLVETFAYLAGVDSFDDESNNGGFGTAVEEYFL